MEEQTYDDQDYNESFRGVSTQVEVKVSLDVVSYSRKLMSQFSVLGIQLTFNKLRWRDGG